MRPIHEWGACEIADAVRGGELSAVEVVDDALARIERINPSLNAFVFVDEDRARSVAAAIDTAVARGEDPGPLAGVPLGIKELEGVTGWPFTLASTVFADRVAQGTSVHVARLLAAGAVPIGLTASPENGYLPYTVSLLHGPTFNPWALDRNPGGSSGGSATAVVAGLVHLATGSDMGGSIRLPAGWSGAVGIKGTIGRIPRGRGYLGFTNLIHNGPLARSVRDAARYIDCACGPDTHDPGSLPRPAEPFEQALFATPVSGLRIAVVDDFGGSPTDAGVRTVLEEASRPLIEHLSASRVERHIDVPPVIESGPAIVFVDSDPSMGEFMSQIMMNLLQTDGAAPLLQDAFGNPNLTIDGIQHGNAIRWQICEALASAFDDVDVILLPTSPVPAFPARGPLPTVVDGREVGASACASFTAPFNFSGHPVVSVPMGMVDGAPVGLQIVTRRHEDALGIRIAAELERIRPWPTLAPIAST